jgi:hypothetical protein
MNSRLAYCERVNLLDRDAIENSVRRQLVEFLVSFINHMCIQNDVEIFDLDRAFAGWIHDNQAVLSET